MRHKLSGRKLGKTTSHRWALFRNMATSLILHGRIETTLPKAKELRSFADHLVTLGKQDTLFSRRRSFDFIRSRDAVHKLFAEIAPRFKDRQGGYTRVLKLGYRLGDSAAMAIIEYLPGAQDMLLQKADKKAKSVKKAKAEKPDLEVKSEAKEEKTSKKKPIAVKKESKVKEKKAEKKTAKKEKEAKASKKKTSK